LEVGIHISSHFQKGEKKTHFSNFSWCYSLFFYCYLLNTLEVLSVQGKRNKEIMKNDSCTLQAGQMGKSAGITPKVQPLSPCVCRNGGCSCLTRLMLLRHVFTTRWPFHTFLCKLPAISVTWYKPLLFISLNTKIGKVQGYMAHCWTWMHWELQPSSSKSVQR
jgi:hypothetical protein